jgi:hypothetical protein
VGDEKALIPIEQKSVDFYGDNVVAVLIELDGHKRIYIPLRPLCDFLGINWDAQRRRVYRDLVLAEEIRGN